MAKIAYQRYAPHRETREKLRLAAGICAEYAAAGLSLTVRQVHYQFVARGYGPNTQAAYISRKETMKNARLGGLIDWDHLVDRTRTVRALPHADSPADHLTAAVTAYHVDRWARQDTYLECWIEKDALVGVIAPVCTRFDVPYFSCRGDVSTSAVWRAAQRMLTKASTADGNGASFKRVAVLYLGDFDPSGLNMSVSMQRYLDQFMAHHGGPDVTLDRIALTRDQIARYTPPPNWVKDGDSPTPEYVAAYGEQSWELDALPPTVIDALIEDAVRPLIDAEIWTEDAVRRRPTAAPSSRSRTPSARTRRRKPIVGFAHPGRDRRCRFSQTGFQRSAEPIFPTP
jgi:hypothetical protein